MAGPALRETSGPAPTGGEGQPAVCPYYREAIELIGKRWTGAIVDSLIPGPMRFSEIAHAVPQMSDRLLSSRLKELEQAGIVARHVLREAPVRVDYELTDKGRALEPALRSVRAWAQTWMK